MSDMRVWKVTEDDSVYHWVTAKSEDEAVGHIVRQYTLADLDLEGIEFKAEALPEDKLLRIDSDDDEPEERTCGEWARACPSEYLACSEW